MKATDDNFTQLIFSMRRVTQKELAKALGLHVSTVSKALKGDPAIARKTVERVRREAEKLGFVPDPMLSALASYRQQLKPEAYHATIAWVYNHSRREPMERFAGYADYFSGAQMRARELGYRLEEFWVGSKSGAAAALGLVLEARGIRGVIVAPQATLEKTLPLPWERYASVAIGYTLREPALDRVTNDHFTTMTELLETLHRRGYRRIGCYLWETDNERMGRRARSAFQAVSREFQSRVKLYREFQADTFLDWVLKYKLDAVVCRGTEQMQVLLDAGYRVPEQIGLAGYALDAKEAGLSGMQHNNSRIGAAAVEWVSGKSQRSQFGLSECPQRLLITSQWLENGTIV